MRTINTHEAKTRLSALLAAVEQRGETVLICRSGRPIAELRPLRRTADPLAPHPELSRIVLRGDPVQPVLDPGDWPDAFEAIGPRRGRGARRLRARAGR